LPPAAPAFFMSSEQFCTDSHCQWVLNEDKWRSLTPSHEMSGEQSTKPRHPNNPGLSIEHTTIARKFQPPARPVLR
jgi:hypothetical protein